MPRIYVEFAQLKQQSDKCTTLAGKIDGIRSNIEYAVSQLDWDVKIGSDVNNTANQIARKLNAYVYALKNYQSFLTDAHDKYARLDDEKFGDIKIGIGTPIFPNLPSSYYRDVPANAYYSDAVNRMTERGLLKGTDDGTFSPERNITAEQYAMVVSRMYGKEFASTQEAWEWAKANRIFPDGMNPAVALTRGQIAELIYHANGGTGDANAARDWAVQKGIFKGDQYGNLNWNDAINRGDTAVVLDRVISNSNSGNLSNLQKLGGVFGAAVLAGGTYYAKAIYDNRYANHNKDIPVYDKDGKQVDTIPAGQKIWINNKLESTTGGEAYASIGTYNGKEGLYVKADDLRESAPPAPQPAQSGQPNQNIGNAINWAKDIANDNTHGYSQSRRNSGVDYDCSSFISEAYRQAGFDIPYHGSNNNNPTTSTMLNDFKNAGFTAIRYDDIGKGGLQAGDILLNPGSHTVLVTETNGKQVQIVHAAQDRGNSKSGDQTGTEILVTNLYGSWQWVLRPPS